MCIFSTQVQTLCRRILRMRMGKWINGHLCAYVKRIHNRIRDIFSVGIMHIIAFVFCFNMKRCSSFVFIRFISDSIIHKVELNKISFSSSSSFVPPNTFAQRWRSVSHWTTKNNSIVGTFGEPISLTARNSQRLQPLVLWNCYKFVKQHVKYCCFSWLALTSDWCLR